jgi:hypothetical protein
MQQEILILLQSEFAKKQFNQINEKEYKKILQSDKLGEACVNSLLQKLLPVFFKPAADGKMYLWQIQPGYSFLQFELGELPLKVEKKYSLDPRNFLTDISLN